MSCKFLLRAKHKAFKFKAAFSQICSAPLLSAKRREADRFIDLIWRSLVLRLYLAKPKKPKPLRGEAKEAVCFIGEA